MNEEKRAQAKARAARMARMPRLAAASGRSVRMAPWIWDGVSQRCRREEDRPAAHAWNLLGAAYALGLLDLIPAEKITELQGSHVGRPQSKSMRLTTWIWQGVQERYAEEETSHWHNPWVLLGAAYATGLIDLPEMVLEYPPEEDQEPGPETDPA